MIANRSTRARATSAAVLVRLVAFVTALIGSVVIVWSFATVALRHAPVEHALLVAAVAIIIMVGAVLAVRTLDPLRH